MKTQHFARWCLLLSVFATAAHADNSQPSPADPSAAATASRPAGNTTTQATVSKEYTSPRAVLTSFLLAVQEKKLDDAAGFLDLATIDEKRRSEAGPELAAKLGALIEDRIPRFEPDLYTDDPEYADDSGQFRFVMTVAKDAEGNDFDEIVLVRGEDGRWRFGGETVEAIPELYKQMREKLQTQPAESTPRAAPTVRADFANARATMRTFLDAMRADPPDLQKAAECLDLSGLPTTVGENERLERAKQLLDVMNRTRVPLLSNIPQTPAGDPYVYESYDHGKIAVSRLEEGERKGEWLFTAETVGQLPEIVEDVIDRELVEGVRQQPDTESNLVKIRKRVPDWLVGKFLGVANWQWLALFVLILAGFAADLVVRSLLTAVINRELRRRGQSIDDAEIRRLIRPIGLTALGVVWSQGLHFLFLPEDLLQYLMPAAKFVAAVAAVWSVYRLVDLLCEYLTSVARRTPSKFDDLLIPMLRKTLKVVVSVMGLAFLSEAFGWPLDKVLAGLGIGGLALGFAARETLQNFFGSITVLLDRPFHIGDWVKVGDYEGSVENVGFRSTRIRTFYNSLITVPNGNLLTATVDNMGARRYRRIKTMLSLTYDTPPEKIDAFCEGVRELILQHPYTRKDYYHVYFNAYDSASLNILLYCFLECPDWGTELREKHRLFNDILRLSRRIGVEFAFPTQTLHVFQETEPSAGTKVPPPEDPQHAGRLAAVDIVKKTGLAGVVPPPVSFDPSSRGSADDDGDGG